MSATNHQLVADRPAHGGCPSAICSPVLYEWGFFARWWDCVAEMLDMSGSDGTIPGLLAERWSYVDLYETEDTVIAPTQAAAEMIFRKRYPWIEVFHMVFRGVYHHPQPKSRRKKRRANDQVELPAPDQKS